jgi:uncharacterized protein YabE (DUF348 family)
MRTKTLVVEIFWLTILSLFTISCASQAASMFTILDGENVHTLETSERIPTNLLAEAQIILKHQDIILVHGLAFPLDLQLPPETNMLQIHRAVPIILTKPGGEQELVTVAGTVGEALHEAGIQLSSADYIDPPANTPLIPGITITYRPSQELNVKTISGIRTIHSSAETVGMALAGAGIPLIGMDESIPPESDPLPADGQVRVIRVNESFTLKHKSIPFETETVSSPDVELGTQEIAQPGQNGLAVIRTRIRYEDGQEVNRITEDESLIQPPQTKIVNTGSKIVVKTATVDGVIIEYWRAYEMYATIYSPCNSGINGCSYGTASGLKAGKGVVAMDPSMYSYLQGARIYVPGYGFAVVGDVGGGYIVEELIGVSRYRWIDLGFDDDNIVDMSGWLTVYFLAPAPASIPPVMQ